MIQYDRLLPVTDVTVPVNANVSLVPGSFQTACLRSAAEVMTARIGRAANMHTILPYLRPSGG